MSSSIIDTGAVGLAEDGRIYVYTPPVVTTPVPDSLPSTGGTLTGPLNFASGNNTATLGFATGPFAMGLNGATMLSLDPVNGVVLAAPPVAPMSAATKAYVDAAVAGFLPLSGGTVQGPFTVVATAGSSVWPNVQAMTVGSTAQASPGILFPSSSGTTIGFFRSGSGLSFAFGTNTANQGSIADFSPTGMSLYQGLDVFAPANFYLPVTLGSDHTTALQAATKQYVDAHAGGGGVAEAPTDGQVYGRQGSTTSWQPTLPLTGGQIDGVTTMVPPTNNWGNTRAPLILGDATVPNANGPTLVFANNNTVAPSWGLNRYGARLYVSVMGADGAVRDAALFDYSGTPPPSFTVLGPMTVTNTFTLNANATTAMQAVPLQQLQTYLPLTGGTLTDNITVANPATTNATSALRAVGVGTGAVGGAARVFLQTDSSTIGRASVSFWSTAANGGSGIWRGGATGTSQQLQFGSVNADGSVSSAWFTAAANGITITPGIGIFGSPAPAARPSVTGSRGGNAALASLITALVSYGLITDNTTA